MIAPPPDTAEFAGMFWTVVMAVVAIAIAGYACTVIAEDQAEDDDEEERRRQALNVIVRFPRRAEK